MTHPVPLCVHGVWPSGLCPQCHLPQPWTPPAVRAALTVKQLRQRWMRAASLLTQLEEAVLVLPEHDPAASRALRWTVAQLIFCLAQVRPDDAQFP